MSVEMELILAIWKQRKAETMARCKVCTGEFTRRNMAPKVCSPDCSVEFIPSEKARKRDKAERLDRRKDREKLEDLQPVQYWLKKAETVVNRYVRLRDRLEGCISCSKPFNWHGQWHAGHYKSVGANSALRFNLWNIHKQCSVCNNHLSGNIGEYAPRLVEKIGQGRFDLLNSSPKRRRYSREYLERLILVFGKKVRLLESRIKKESENSY